jgi:hypothetical protein
VSFRPCPEDPIGTRYSIMVWSDETRWVWNGCDWVCVPRWGCAGRYVFDGSRWIGDECVSVRLR